VAEVWCKSGRHSWSNRIVGKRSETPHHPTRQNDMAPQQRTVQIGPGRRLTLEELDALARCQAKLQWNLPGAAEDVPAPDVSSLELAADNNNDDSGSAATCIAVWTILAFQFVQGENSDKSAEQDLKTAAALVECVNRVQATGTGGLLPPSIGSIIDPVQMYRAFTLATIGLATFRAKTILTPKTLAAAALSIDALGRTEICLAQFQEVHFDIKRPDRNMMNTASILRAILHDSKNHNTTDSGMNGPNNNDSYESLLTVPQYHGPATADLEAATIRLQLEINAPSTVEGSAVALAAESLVRAARLQILKSSERLNLFVPDQIVIPPKEPTEALPAVAALVVEQWSSVIEQEATAALAIIIKTVVGKSSAGGDEEDDNTTKAATKGPSEPPATEDNNFEGKTEAQIAKILKKRAEKEAKAAAKRANKQGKSKTLYATAITAIAKAWQDSSSSSSNKSNNDDTVLAKTITTIFEQSLSGGVQRKPKIAKGTRDYLPDQMKIRQQAFSIIRRVFESHGAVEIDTPVFELKDTLTGKYGEDSKLIYDLADQGGELLALRYDLTVPFARFLALNSVGNIKRFHIGKVYRRDQPALKKGRYREFYQCDFDIAGTYGRMVPDAECLCVACDILDALPIGDFAIKLNHRRLLDAIFDLCGVPMSMFRTVCSSVDKLDKFPWEEVKREMMEDKGLDEAVADKIGTFVLFKGKPFELHKQLVECRQFGDHQAAGEAMEDLRILFEYLEAFDKLRFISFDLSLARGLDYYTGVIYEAVCMSETSEVGSIGGGGRYDNLVSMFQEAGKQTPCVGVSVGIERVFTLMEARVREEKGSLKQPTCSVYIASTGSSLMTAKMKVASLLWNANISAEFGQKENAKLTKEIQGALEREIPFVVVVGENEWADGKCQLKDLAKNTADLVPIQELVSVLREKGVIPVGCEFAAELLAKESASS
jgi:histidyl-tRNA synthetase